MRLSFCDVLNFCAGQEIMTGGRGLDQASMVTSEHIRKIQSTAQQALAQCMELGLHVLPIQRWSLSSVPSSRY